VKKNIFLIKFIYVMVFLLTVLQVSAENVEFSILNNVELKENGLIITTDKPIKYNIFKISNPTRLVIDLLNTENNISEDKRIISLDNNPVIKRIRIGQFQNEPTKIARVVIDLIKDIKYNSYSNENKIMLNFISDKIVNTAEVEKTIEVVEEPKKQEPKIEQTTLQEVKPKQEEQPPKKEIKQDQQIKSVEEKHQPEEQKPQIKPAEQIKQEQPQNIKPTINQKKIEIVKQPKKIQETKNVKKEKTNKKEITEKQPKEFYPKVDLPKTLVSLEYQDADIRDVLQVMAIRSGINIIYGSDVAGTLTISLKNVPFDQAFNTILELKGLTSIPVNNNTIRVLTPQQLVLERSQAVTFTKIFPLNYATANEVMSQIDAIRTLEGRKGLTLVDVRTNSLIITDTKEGLESIEKFIKQIDVKPRQVVIEAKIVDINLTDLRSFGINWSYENVELTPGSELNVNKEAKTIGDISVEGGKLTGEKANITSAQSPIPGGSLFSFGYISNTQALIARLGAIISQGKGKILSNPRITTLNNKNAKILVGEKVPYKTTTIGAGGTTQESWQFLEAGVKLTVTPSISPDGWVILNVQPEVSVPQPAPPGTAPPIKTRQTEATVMVKNNDTIVIGGLISENELRDIQKLPFLGDLPILGYLFKYKSDSKTKTELVIFITPRILEE